MLLPEIYIDQIPGKGRGVFAAAPLEAGMVVESAPVIVMSAEERVWLDKTLLHDYIFEWGEDRRQCAVALGWISLFNHSDASNCEYFMEYGEALMYVRTIRPVMQGEELTVNYNGEWNQPGEVWFEKKP